MCIHRSCKGFFFHPSFVFVLINTYTYIYTNAYTFADPFGPAQYRKCNAPDPFLFVVSTSR